MSARQATNALAHAIFQRTGIQLSFDDANTLRRAELTLQRWAEEECNRTIMRGGVAGFPFRRVTPIRIWAGKDCTGYARIPDREAGALRRVAEVCKRNGMTFQRSKTNALTYKGN